MAQCCADQGLQVNLEGWITCGSVSGCLIWVRVCVMGIDSPVGWRCGSSGGIVLFELLDGHITQKFVDVGRKVDGARRPSGVGYASRRGIERLPWGKGGDIRRPIEVGSMDLVEFLCWHVNAAIRGARGRAILGIEVFRMVRRQVMLVGSSRGWRGPRF